MQRLGDTLPISETLQTSKRSESITKSSTGEQPFSPWNSLNHIWKEISLLDPLLYHTSCITPDWFLFMSSLRHKAPWSQDYILYNVWCLKCLLCAAYRDKITSIKLRMHFAFKPPLKLTVYPTCPVSMFICAKWSVIFENPIFGDLTWKLSSTTLFWLTGMTRIMWPPLLKFP